GARIARRGGDSPRRRAAGGDDQQRPRAQKGGPTRQYQAGQAPRSADRGRRSPGGQPQHTQDRPRLAGRDPLRPASTSEGSTGTLTGTAEIQASSSGDEGPGCAVLELWRRAKVERDETESARPGERLRPSDYPVCGAGRDELGRARLPRI